MKRRFLRILCRQSGADADLDGVVVRTPQQPPQLRAVTTRTERAHRELEIRLEVGGADVGVHQIVLVLIRIITRRHLESPPTVETPGLRGVGLRSGVITGIHLENRVNNDVVDADGHAHPHLSTESHMSAD